MPKWVVVTLHVVLAIALAGSVFVQTFMAYLVWVDLDEAPRLVRYPLTAIFVLGIVCLQVIGVAVWKLLGLVRQGQVFSHRAFRYVNWVIGAVLTGAVLIFGIAVVAAPGEEVAPGVILLICGASFVACGIALVVHVMKLLLAQAVDLDARATALQHELDEVI